MSIRLPLRSRRGIARLALGAAVLLALGSLPACSSSAHGAKPTTPTKAPTGATPDVAAFPSALHLDPERVFNAFLDQQYGDNSAVRWFLGLGESKSGQTAQLEVDALASTAAEATRYCAAIAGPAAFFMKGVPFTLEIGGQVKVALGTTPGAFSFQPAPFIPVACPKPDGPLLDPFRANEPHTANDAIDRLDHFLAKYYNDIGASNADSWYAGYGYVGTGTKIQIAVHDATAAAGTKRCAMVQPLAAWLLGPFANQLTVQVRGSSRTGSTSWAAVNCPS